MTWKLGSLLGTKVWASLAACWRLVGLGFVGFTGSNMGLPTLDASIRWDGPRPEHQAFEGGS